VKHHASVEELPPGPPETVRQKLTFWQYRMVWAAAAALPGPIADRAPKRIGQAWFAAASDKQANQVRENIARIAGHPGEAEVERLTRLAFESYARYWIDAFRLHKMDGAEVVAQSTGENLEVMDDLLADGNGAIMATAHIGSWDVGAFFTTQRNWGMVVVAEVLEPRRLFTKFVDLRRDAGLDVIPLVRGGNMVDRLVEVVERGGLATLLADRDLGRKGPVVEFFGEPCRLPPGTSILARKTKRPVCIGGFVTNGPNYHGVIQEPVDISHLSVEAGTQVIAHELEKLIGRYPEQWHVFVRNWLVEREPEHPALRVG
jgi:lauroyl/myristoyl acyltransferase